MLKHNKETNKSKFFYSDFVPIQVYTKTGSVQYPEYYTMDPKISEEEAEHGVVSKERVKIDAGIHQDVITYADGSVLINEYRNGVLVSQTEKTHNEGYDPNNPKEGDWEETVTRKYNNENVLGQSNDTKGSYIEYKQIGGYSEQQGDFLYFQRIDYSGYTAYDKDGNKYYYPSPEFMKIYEYIESHDTYLL